MVNRLHIEMHGSIQEHHGNVDKNKQKKGTTINRQENIHKFLQES